MQHWTDGHALLEFLAVHADRLAGRHAGRGCTQRKLAVTDHQIDATRKRVG